MLDRKVIELFNLKEKGGTFGIEIEMELNRTFYSDYAPAGWRIEEDGSLRGYSCELVLRQPCGRNAVGKQVNKVIDTMEKLDIHIRPTIRAGIHIHMNMQKHTLGEVYKFLAVYYCMETFLVKNSGIGRSGNLFCLRAEDAVGTFGALSDAIELGNVIQLNTDNLRYSAMNIRPLFSYGSLEYRALATGDDLTKIETWTERLYKILEYSKSIKSVWDIPSQVSGLGPRQWLETVLGKEDVDNLHYNEIEDDVFNDVRNMQFIIHLMKMKGL